MNLPVRQRGFLLIVAVVLIAVAATMAVVIATLTAGSGQAGGGHVQSTQALFIAESGMERALNGFKSGTACGSLSYPNVSVGQGSFTATGTLYNPSSTTLSSNISATDTYIPVASVAGYATHGRITIGTEAINYTGTSASSCGAFAAPCLTGVTRGVSGTTAAAHALGTSVPQNQCVIQSVGTVGNAMRTVERATSSTSGSVGAMMVYAKATGDNRPYYRIWDGSAWGAEFQATAVTGGSTINYIVLKFARTRDEAILGTLDSTGAVRVQVWDGTSWGATTLLGNVGAGNAGYSGFDIEYETSGDRAVAVYGTGAANQASCQYWSGGPSWTSCGTLTLATIGVPNWIEMAPNPLSTSNEIALIALGSNTDVYGMRWNGSAWSSMPGTAPTSTTWDASATIATRKVIDVAYERQTGRAMFIWGSSTNRRQRYRFWDGAALSGIGDLDIGAMGSNPNPGKANWIRLAPNPDPASKQLMYSVQDDRLDLNTCLWTGLAWDCIASPHPEHDSSTESTDRNSDVVFETTPANYGKAWLLWGNGSRVTRRQWNGTSWLATTTVGDDTAHINLMAHPTTGAVFSGIYERSTSATRDIWESHLTGGGTVWSAKFTAWGGSTPASPVYDRIALAPERSGLTLYDWIEVFP